MDRKAELEKRRKKVEELKRQRLEMAQAKANLSNQSRVSPMTDRASTGGRDKEKQDVNDLLSSILGDSRPSSRPETPDPGKVETISSSAVEAPAQAQTPSQPQELSRTEAYIISIPGKTKICYEKGCQTDAAIIEDIIETGVQEKLQAINSARRAEAEEAEAAAKIASEEANKNAQEIEIEVQKEEIDLPEEKVVETLQSDAFIEFFDQSTRLIERSLQQCTYDFAKDYSGDSELNSEKDSGELLSLFSTYFSEKWTAYRTCTDMDWSINYPELFVCSYGSKEIEQNVTDPNGVCLIWNTHLKERPEYVFQCQSPVMSCRFAKFHPALVLGGTYSGQIVLWDKRAKATPVQRSTLSSKSHTHPVYCLDIVGSRNAHNLVSCSTDGLMCSWNLDMLNEPQETTLLQSKIRSIAVTSMTFSQKDVNNFVVGTEEGPLYIGNRHAGQGGKNESQIPGMSGHYGPVTSVNHHPSVGEIDFSDYILSSSTDWTVKLWSQENKKLVYSFEGADDYVYDVQWSPTHPAVFACVDGSSKLSIWNLNLDFEFPLVQTTVSEKSALNRIKWTPDGKSLAVSDGDGNVYVYEVGESVYNPKPESWSKFKDVLNDLYNISATDGLASSG